MKALAAMVVGGVCSASAADIAVVWRNAFALPATAVNQFGAPTAIGGLSGITMLGDGRFAAVSDSAGAVALLSVSFGADGALTGATAMALSLGTTHDYEDAAWSAADAGAVYLVDEGADNGVWRADLASGAVTAGPARPAVFNNARADCGLNALAFSGDGGVAWTANQEALTVDGDRATRTAGTRVRLQRFARSGGTYLPDAQYAYITEPVYGAVQNSGNSRSGVVALTVLPGGGVLVTEQSYYSNTGGYWTRMFALNTAGALDVSGYPSLLSGPPWSPAGKTPLLGANYTNLEGLCLGPRLANGDYVLLGVVDDGDPLSVSRLLSFVMSGAGCGISDLGQQGGLAGPDGLLDNNDFVVFIGWFFGLDGRADMGRQGGLAGSDGEFDNNDFVVFIDRFFAGCP